MGSTRQLVSAHMRAHPFVSGLCSRLGDRVVHTTGMLRPGEIGMDTVGPDGMSLRAYARMSNNKRSVSLLNMTGGRERVYFSSERKLMEYIPGQIGAIRDFALLVERLGGDMSSLQWNEKTSVSVTDALREMDAICDCVLRLSAPVGASVAGGVRRIESIRGTHEALTVSDEGERLVRKLSATQRPPASASLWCGNGCDALTPCSGCRAEMTSLLAADSRTSRTIRKVLARAAALAVEPDLSSSSGSLR